MRGDVRAITGVSSWQGMFYIVQIMIEEITVVAGVKLGSQDIGANVPATPGSQAGEVHQRPLSSGLWQGEAGVPQASGLWQGEAGVPQANPSAGNQPGVLSAGAGADLGSSQLEVSIHGSVFRD